jgi:23S rRNA pseudouridine1911/1915/1917 synthase
VLAVCKPAGLLTQGVKTGEATLEDHIRRQLGPTPYLGTVHRLDRPVSGVVVWARTPKAARRLSEQFARRSVVKEYWAVVECAAEPGPTDSGVWDDWLARSPDASGVVRAASRGDLGARQALTRFRWGDGGRVPDGTVWFRLWPETGRTHQIRAQAAFRGLPVWGDVVYGSLRSFPEGIALHARALTFEHPILHRPVTVTADPPEVWRRQGIELPGSVDPGPAAT